MSDPETGNAPVNAKAKGGWQAVIEDMAATAEAYREREWTTLELHPGDAVAVDSEYRTGIDLLLSGPEYEELEDLADTASFTEYEVFRAERGGIVHLLVVEQDPRRETAVFAPAYYDPASSRDALSAIEASGVVRLFCRRLNDDYVEFVHDDPSPFLP